MLEFLNPFEWSTSTYLLAIVLMVILHRLVPQRGPWYRRLGRETLIIAPAVFLYFAVRGIVSSRDTDPYQNAETIIRAQDRMGVFFEPEVQSVALRSETLVTTANWIYIWGHWPIVICTLIWLILARPATFSIYRNAFLISGMLAMFIFALYPVAPPRLMPELMLVDTVTEQSRSYRALQPPALTNPYAAMPSLHFGWNLLMGIALVREARLWYVRWFGYAIPIAMFVAIILTANHYFLDGIAGGALILGSLWVSLYLLHERGFLRRAGAGSTADRPARFRVIGGSSLRPNHVMSERTSPITIAHRAGNSISTALAAQEAGADVVECDLWLHRERLEVRHSKTLGPIPIRWDRWWIEPVNAHCLELSDLIRATSPATLLMLDLKGRNPDLPHRLIETVRRLAPEREFVVCSQNWSLLDELVERPGISVVYSIGSRRQLRSRRTRIASGALLAVSIDTRLLDERTMSTFRKAGLLVITWPVNSNEQFERVSGLGVDGVISDEMSMIAGIVKARTGGDESVAQSSSTVTAHQFSHIHWSARVDARER